MTTWPNPMVTACFLSRLAQDTGFSKCNCSGSEPATSRRRAVVARGRVKCRISQCPAQWSGTDHRFRLGRVLQRMRPAALAELCSVSPPKEAEISVEASTLCVATRRSKRHALPQSVTIKDVDGLRQSRGKIDRTRLSLTSGSAEEAGPCPIPAPRPRRSRS